MIIKEFVNPVSYSFNIVLVEAAFSFNNCISACLFPTDKNNERKKGQRISQGETFTLMAKAPEIALTTKRVEIVKISAIRILFKKKVYNNSNTKKRIMIYRKVGLILKARINPNPNNSIPNNPADILPIFPEASGLDIFSGLSLSFSVSTKSLTIYPVEEIKAREKKAITVR